MQLKYTTNTCRLKGELRHNLDIAHMRLKCSISMQLPVQLKYIALMLLEHKQRKCTVRSRPETYLLMNAAQILLKYSWNVAILDVIYISSSVAQMK